MFFMCDKNGKKEVFSMERLGQFPLIRLLFAPKISNKNTEIISARRAAKHRAVRGDEQRPPVSAFSG